MRRDGVGPRSHRRDATFWIVVVGVCVCTAAAVSNLALGQLWVAASMAIAAAGMLVLVLTRRLP